MYSALGLWVLKLEKWTFVHLFLFKKLFNFSKILCIWVFFLAHTCASLVPSELSLGSLGTIVYIAVSCHVLLGAEHRSSGLLTTEQMFRPDLCLFFDADIKSNYFYQYLMTFVREIWEYLISQDKGGFPKISFSVYTKKISLHHSFNISVYKLTLNMVQVRMSLIVLYFNA